MEKLKVHYTAQYIIDPPHPVTVNVIGCGGTGSQVLSSLARMHSALTALGHPGLFIRAIDPDKVTSANMGRQLFSPSDIEEYKCMVLIGRINRFFGTEWEALPVLYNSTSSISSANITISCVDTGKARKEIKAALKKVADGLKPRKKVPGHYISQPTIEPYHQPYYWMDFGNTMDRGQMVIGTVMPVPQPKSEKYDCVRSLSTVDKLHPDIFRDNKNDDQGPSCSLAEALHKQDLFVNTNLANFGLGILWKMFRELHIKYHGCYMNLDTMSSNPIKII
ncbi:MAG: PRTRC system ThiF family protein [Taibaiella sp.]|jgi:PRTRC genetic system ThiF family protein